MSEQTAKRWVIHGLLRAAAGLAKKAGIAAPEFGHMAEVALYREVAADADGQAEIATRLDVSVRTVATLSKSLKLLFGADVDALSLERRVLFTLWTGPLSAARLAQALNQPTDEIQGVIDGLVEQGVIRAIEGRTTTYSVSSGEARRVGHDWPSRLDALHNLAGAVANTVDARFFRGEQDAFARTLTLRVRPSDMDRLSALYEQQIWETLRRIDAAANDTDDAREMELAIVWAPLDSSGPDGAPARNTEAHS